HAARGPHCRWHGRAPGCPRRGARVSVIMRELDRPLPRRTSRGRTMDILRGLGQGIAVMAFVSMAGGSPALAGTFVYVSTAEDGDISVYGLQPDGALTQGTRVPAAKVVMPMAVSPDRRFLYAGVRSKPYSVH